MKNSLIVYQNRILSYTNLSKVLEKRIHSLGNWRLASVIAGFIIATLSYKIGLYYLLFISTIIFTSAFIYLVTLHHKVKSFYKYIVSILTINENSIKRLEGNWIDFQYTGEEFCDEDHEYSQDLDIFGRGSLFQWINTTNTEYGGIKLKEFLTKPCFQKEILVERQQAIKELARKRWWRQKYQAEAMQIVEEMRENNNLIVWMNDFSNLYSRKDLIYVIRILPLFTVLSYILSFGFDIIPRIIPLLASLIHIGLFLIGFKNRNNALKTICTYQKNINVYGKMLKHLEKSNFESRYINTLKNKIKNQEGLTAFNQLSKLQKIVNSISNRSNQLFLPINIILLWDYQCMIDLEKWKNKSGKLVEKWLVTIGEMEALSSLAVINFDYPNWAIPEFTSKTSVLKARNLGHPLLTNKQVYNDLIIEEPKKILLITGSNMSGKSTLLRTTGINLVLAYAGASVCAENFQCSFMRLYSCMRTSDNLEKNISSFYAELLRIKEIISATNENRQIFFLLDEVLKGTNSQDRHLGAKMLITKLYKQDAIGLVSTHDLELSELEEESKGKVVNYNFQEYYKENQIYFDYKLRRGVSATKNALYLMKMVGIETKK